jgi:Uma2 family endonuclease
MPVEERSMAIETSRTKIAPANVLRGVDWETYNRLRDHPSNGHIRMSYLDGTLILMSPELIHDRYGRRLAMVIDEVTEALGIFVEGIATTTLRLSKMKRAKGTGKEPDYGFYFGQNAIRMHRRVELNLEVDPPPDLAIEVDYKADSAKALKLYARLGVPEVWRYKPPSQELWFGRLAGETYASIDRSLALPRLTPALVLSALARIDEVGTSAAKPWLRDWARGLPDPIV